MTVTQMKYFEAVCRNMNVTKAANELYVSRSAVSRALKELEDELNATLFRRSRIGVELTESGKMLRNVFAEFNGAYSTLKECLKNNESAETEQVLSIGITTTTGSRLFPEFIAGFKAARPDVRLRIVEKPAYQSQDAVLGGDIDFFITPDIEDTKSAKIESKYIYSTEMRFCVSASSPLAGRSSVTFDEICGIDRVSLMAPLPMVVLSKTFTGSVEDCDDEAEVIITTSQHDLIKKVISSGIAASFLPLEIAEGWEGVVPIPFDPAIIIPVNIIWRKAPVHTNAFDAFMSFIEDYDFTTL